MEPISNYDYISKVMALATEGSLLRKLMDNAYVIDVRANEQLIIQGDYKHRLIAELVSDGVEPKISHQGYTEGRLRLADPAGDMLVQLVFT
jgi:hypothetical protein